MRKVKLFVANSLDNFIARPDGGVDWLFTDGDYGMRAFFKSVDTALMGRKTYDWALAHGGSPDVFKGMTQYVFSRARRGRGKTPEGVRFVSGDVRSFVETLRRADGKDIWLMGGGELTESFLRERLIDEFILTVHPTLLGAGLPLFRGEYPQTELKLLKCKTYKTGLVQLSYGLR